MKLHSFTVSHRWLDGFPPVIHAVVAYSLAASICRLHRVSAVPELLPCGCIRYRVIPPHEAAILRAQAEAGITEVRH